jgi:FixJ family two-component response regulator
VKHEDFQVHVVDSDQAIADGLATLLTTYGIEVLNYPDIQSFLKSWLPRRPCNCCLITEADPPGFSGRALLRELRELHVDIPVLLLVSTNSPESIDVARSSGRIGAIRKPCLDHKLVQRVLNMRSASLAECSNRRTAEERLP